MTEVHVNAFKGQSSQFGYTSGWVVVHTKYSDKAIAEWEFGMFMDRTYQGLAGAIMYEWNRVS